MDKKLNLISVLKKCIDALQNDIVEYDWKNTTACNIGLVAQVALDISYSEFDDLRTDFFTQFKEKKGNADISLSWKNAVKYTCPITGKNLPTIIKNLESFGIDRKDIVQLEYLENPAILEESGILKENYIVKTLIKNKEEKVLVDSTSFLGKLFKLKEEKTIVTPIYESKEVFDYPQHYYAKKENLIKYLKAWVRILERTSAVKNMESELIVLLAEEKYEEAAKLRDLILFKNEN